MLVFQERLNWLMDHRGISPTELSLMSGLSRQYINNLLHGHKANPTLAAARCLAGSLKTTVAFLEGETANPDPWTPQEQVPNALCEFLTECNPLHVQVQQMSVEERVCFVLHFARARFPEQYFMDELQFQLGLSKQALNDVLGGRFDVGPYTLEAVVKITGVDMIFFATGDLPQMPNSETEVLARKRSIQKK